MIVDVDKKAIQQQIKFLVKIINQYQKRLETEPQFLTREVEENLERAKAKYDYIIKEYPDLII